MADLNRMFGLGSGRFICMAVSEKKIITAKNDDYAYIGQFGLVCEEKEYSVKIYDRDQQIHNWRNRAQYHSNAHSFLDKSARRLMKGRKP